MPDPQGFLRYGRSLPARRPVPVRITDWREVYPSADDELIRDQATRCMDCGVPFCQEGCPLGNRIPDWNDLVRTGRWSEAAEQLHATNNFPEFTGRLCPAPCEASCVLGIADDAVTIKQIEVEIIDRAYAAGRVTPRPAGYRTGRRVAVIGSGPAGLAAAQQLARAGHAVTVYERDDRIGGLLRYGIPDFKMEKHRIDRRVAQLTAEGVSFVTSCAVGTDVTGADLHEGYDAIVLACGALAGRDMPEVPGRDLPGIHLAMDHLVASNRAGAAAGASAAAGGGGDASAGAGAGGGGDASASAAAGGGGGGGGDHRAAPAIDAAGKHVVIIGGGDTAADCLGVAHRQGARSVTQLDMYPQPPRSRDPERDPWPTWPWVLREYPAHEEGGERVFAVAVREFVGTDRLRAIRISEVTVTRVDGRRTVTEIPGTVRDLPADLVLLAIGFEGTERQPLLDQLGVVPNPYGAVDCGPDWQVAPDVFVAGDMHKGASLIVWAIAEGRAAAAAVHRHLGFGDPLPAPVSPATQPLSIIR